MGNNKSKPQTTSVILVNPGSPTVVHGSEDKTEEIMKLIKNIRIVLDQMKESIKLNPKIPKDLCGSLFKDLESLNNVLNPQRMHVCYIVGGTCAGKSSLINSIVNKNICCVSRTAKAGTKNFEIVLVPEVNTAFVDTVGFGSNLDDSDLVKKFEKEQQTNSLPDSILLVVTQEQLRNEASLKNTIDYINKVVKRVENTRHNIPVPVICVLNKIDQYLSDDSSGSEDPTKIIKEGVQEAIEIVNKYLEKKASQCIATSATKNYGIDELRSSINAQSPLNAQIISNTIEYMRKHRWVIANKIIASFSTASAAVSLLPLVDIPIVTLLQHWMYRLLGCLSMDPNRTPDTFEKKHAIATRATFIVRAGASIVGAVLQLSVIAYLVGSSVCVTAAASSTAALGWASYRYFTSETSSE